MPKASPIPKDRTPDFLEATRAQGALAYTLTLAGLSWGFRVSELLALTVGHVLSADGRVRSTVTLERRYLKFGASAQRAKVHSRTVPVCQQLRDAIAELLRVSYGFAPPAPHLPLFPGRFPGKPLDRKTVERIIARAAADIGLDPDKTWSPHTFRKTYARAVYNASGHDVIAAKKALGHSSILTTQAYLPMDEEEVLDVIAAGQAELFGAPTRSPTLRAAIA